MEERPKLPPRLDIGEKQREKDKVKRFKERRYRETLLLTKRALKVFEFSMSDYMMAAEPGVALAAAKDVMDRAGLSSKTVHEHVGPNGGPIQSQLTVRFIEAGDEIDNKERCS